MSRYVDLWARAERRKSAGESGEQRAIAVQARARDMLNRMLTVEEFRARGASQEALDEFLRIRRELEAAARDPDAQVRFGGRPGRGRRR